MNKAKILADAKRARKLLDGIIRELEPGGSTEEVSFMDQTFVKHEPASVKTIRKFIDERVGVFKCDIVTAADMCETLNHPSYKHLLQGVAENYYTPSLVGRLYRSIGNIKTDAVNVNRKTVRLCVIRDFDRYESMSTRQLGDEYAVQLEQLEQPSSTV